MKLNNDSFQKLSNDTGLFLWNGKTPAFEDSVHCLLFQKPVKTLTLYHPSSPEHLKQLFEEIEKGLSMGLYAAGWLAYEAGYLMLPKLRDLTSKIRPSVPLAWFGLYSEPIKLPKDCLNLFLARGIKKYESHPITLKFDTSRQDFIRAINTIHSYIKSGDTYQINYTIRGRFDFSADAFHLFCLLRQRQNTGYGAFIRPYKDLHILSISPELFFARQEEQIWSRPMKGTAPRGKNKKEDRKLASVLGKDEKNRAENVMIVDLLRNDLGKICQIGTVQVPELFCVERYETLFQMTSTVQGTLCKDTSWSEVFRAIFPCGSITGAPKIRSMEIIAELENTPRGIYTGAIGYICPDNSAIFNVAIRTVTINKNIGEIGIGAGITIGSEPYEEYDETLLKAKFLTMETC